MKKKQPNKKTPVNTMNLSKLLRKCKVISNNSPEDSYAKNLSGFEALCCGPRSLEDSPSLAFTLPAQPVSSMRGELKDQRKHCIVLTGKPKLQRTEWRDSQLYS